jgi:Pyruvate/2-oxoacid:ferredoxin oxidoreductase delta subunit
MAIREIIKIDEELCDGCGQCVPSCAEGAIQMINGKAKLVSEVYCDGLGACLGDCPQGAISMEKRDVADFDEVEVKKHLEKIRPEKVEEKKEAPQAHAHGGGGCPGSRMMQLDRKPAAQPVEAGSRPSQLGHWPVKLHLVHPAAPYFQDAELVLAADCGPFAMADFHENFMTGRALAICCPKFDNMEAHIEKLAAIIVTGSLKKIVIAHMEVPCCFGLRMMVERAMEKAGQSLPVDAVTIGVSGEIKKTEQVRVA